MEVIVAKTAGFCFGVKRAVDMVYERVNEPNVYTYGPIIHNETVTNDLAKLGVVELNQDARVSDVNPGTVFIRAHGVEEHVYDEISDAGHKIIDATCPFVLKIHKIVKEAVQNGQFVVVIGDANHPEVIGIRSCGMGRCVVLNSADEVMDFLKTHESEELSLKIVAQTTYNHKKFQELVEIFNKNIYYKVDVVNTICNATHERQTEASKLAKEVDAMIVIGSKNSSNSQKLYDICKADCAKTFFIQSAEELDYSMIRGLDKVGITAGASTPENIIKEVQTKCQI